MLIGFKSYLFCFFVVVVVFDQFFKWKVEQMMSLYECIEFIFGFFQFVYVINDGIVFGFFLSGGSFVGIVILVIFGLLVFVVVIFYFLQMLDDQKFLLMVFVFVFGGVIGNFIDCLMCGEVMDFFDVYIGQYYWFIFNVVDLVILVGIVFFVIEMLCICGDQLSDFVDE